MIDDTSLLEELADAVLDGRPIDWDSVRPNADEATRDLLDELRVLAEIGVIARTPDHAHPDVPANTPVPARWGHLQLLERIGGGSFGEVYRAWDSRLDREVALKLLHRAQVPSADAVSSLIHEGRLLAKVRHHNVVTVYGADEVDGQTGIWMELVHGRTLEALVAEDGPIASTEVISIGIALCDALSAVHAAGLLHRDIKAQNVMRATDGRIVLMDFGAGHENHALDGRVDPAGTPLYVAPEILQGKPATPSSDLYSVGVVLFHLATGSYPVTGRTLAELRVAHANGALFAARTLEHLPRRLARVLLRALTTDPVARYESAAALRAALASLQRAWIPSPGWALMLCAAVGLALTIVGWPLDRLSVRQPNEASVAASPADGTLDALALRALRSDLRIGVTGTPSLDGRFLSYADEEHGDIAVLDIVNRRSQRLHVNASADDRGRPTYSALSADGSRIAFAWEQGSSGALRLLTIATHERRTLFADENVSVVRPLQWTRGDDAVLAFVGQRSPRELLLVLIDTNTGERTILKNFGTTDVNWASVSPDGRYAVYDLPQSPTAPRDIFILDLETRREQPLIAHPADDTHPVWTPDGARVQFASDRTGSRGFWLQRIADGHPAGPPELIRDGIGRFAPLGLTADGSFYFGLQTGLVDVYIATLDPLTGTLATPAVPALPTAVGSSMSSYWSPDGRSLMFVHLGDQSQRNRRAVVILDTETGTSQQIVPRMNFFALPRWSADGATLVVNGFDLQDRQGMYGLNPDDGSITPLVLDPRGLFWGPDGVGGTRLVRWANSHSLVWHDRTNGQEQTLLDIGEGWEAERSVTPVFSHDREWLAVTVHTPDQSTVAVLLGNLTTGRVSVLQKVMAPERVRFAAWSPDDESVFVTRTPTSDSNALSSLWRVPRTGGVPVDVGLEMTGLRNVQINPDGRRVSFTAGWPIWEPWVMQHYLPAAAAR